MSQHNHLKETVEAMFKTKTAPSGVFTIKRGMQFSRPGILYMWIGFMLLILGAILSFMNAAWILGIVLGVAAPFILLYIIDIQGIEIDFNNGKIRKYQSYLGIKSGEWIPLSAFDSVRVYLEQLQTRREKFTSRGPKKYDTHSYYYVRLVSPDLNTSISLLALSDYERAKYQAEKVARHARLTFIAKPAKLKIDKVK